MRVEATGYKLLNGTRSLNGRIDYSQALAKKWQHVPDRGAFVAHSDGLFSACTAGNRVVRVECAELVSSPRLFRGVKCWRYVRMRPATAEADGEALAALVRADAEDALRYGAQALARIVPPSAWADVIRRAPYEATQYATRYLAEVVPADVWAEAFRIVPCHALRYAARYLARRVPPKAWEAAVRRAPYGALQYAAQYLADVVPVEAWMKAIRMFPDEALRYAAGHLAGVVPAEAWAAARASCAV